MNKKAAAAVILIVLPTAWQSFAAGEYSGWPLGTDEGVFENIAPEEGLDYYYPPENGAWDWEIPLDKTVYGDFCFDKEEGEITAYTGSGGYVEIPQEIDGVRVKSIYGGGQFRTRSGGGQANTVLERSGAFTGEYPMGLYVKVPEGVVAIDGCAFYNSGLSGIELPESLQTIGAFSFAGTDISEIELPNTIKTLPAGVFCDTKLKNVTLPDSVETVGGSLFYTESQISGRSPLYYTERAGAFSRCFELESVVLGENTKTIGEYAFSYCTSLERIFIPESVQRIDKTAFFHTDNVTIYTKSGSFAEKFARANGISVRCFEGGDDLSEYEIPAVEIDGQTAEIGVEIKNNFGDGGCLITAAYDENGVLIDVRADEEFLDSIDWMETEWYKRTVKADGDISRIRAFIWDEAGRLEPLCLSAEGVINNI